METKEFLKAVEEIKDYACDKYNEPRKNLEVVQVWYCKTIQNHKGLFIIKNTETKTIYPYFVECTYNGDAKEMYMDFYTKEFKHTIVF